MPASYVDHSQKTLVLMTGYGDLGMISSYGDGIGWNLRIHRCPPGAVGLGRPHPDDVDALPLVVAFMTPEACNVWIKVLSEHRRRLVEEPNGPYPEAQR
jgi:hypothetical protein